MIVNVIVIKYYIFVVQSDKTLINSYDDLCKFFKKKQIEYKQSFVKKIN